MKLSRLLSVVVTAIILLPVVLVEWIAIFAMSIVWHVQKFQSFRETWRDAIRIRKNDDRALKNFVKTGKFFYEKDEGL